MWTWYYESWVEMDMTKLIPLSYYTEWKVWDISLYDDLFTLWLTEEQKDNFWRRWTPELPDQWIATWDLVITWEKLELFDLTFLRSVGVDFLKYRLLSWTIFDEPEEYPRESWLQFVWWYEEDDLNTRIDFPIIITGDITLYPKFLNVYCSFITDNSEFWGVKITWFSWEQSQACLNNFVVPREIDWFDVVEIADNSFNWDLADAQIISWEINLPDTIRRIGNNAFMNNNISSWEFRFPKNITHLEAQAFYGNRISWTIKFPWTIESKMMWSAFRCNFVEKVVIWTGIVQVNQDAYNTTPCPDRATLTSVEFPSTLTKILHDAFYGQNIQWVDLPDWLTSIGSNAFYNNSISWELVLPSSLTTIDSLAFYNNNISWTLVIPWSISTVTTAFRCNPIREVVFGEWVKKIDSAAFSSDLANNVCPEWKGRTIKSIDLPDSLKEIWENAFLSQKIEWEFVFPASLTKLWVWAFKNNNISWTLRIPWNYGSWKVNWAFKCNLIEKVIFSEGIRIIWDQAFYANDTNCSKDHFTIKSVEFPSTLTGINYNAFRDHQLSSVTIWESVENIWHNAFDNQHDSSWFTLKTVLLRWWTTLENNAFISNDMESIYIPDSIESFWTDVFKSSGNTYITWYVTTKKSTLNYTWAYIKPVYQLYTYTFVDETGTVLWTWYYPEILESNTTKLIPLDYYNWIGDISTFTSVDSLINPGAWHVVRWSTELSENSVVTENLVVTWTVEDISFYTITYDSTTNGWTKEQQERLLDYGESVDLSLTWYKEWWTFLGWSTSENTTGVVSNLTATNDITLYAVYKQEAVTPKLHVHLNWNTSFSNTTTSHTEDAVFDICTIPEVYNLETQDENCSISWRIFNITANWTKTPLWWSLSANTWSQIIYAPWENIILTWYKSNPEVHLYAQSLLTWSTYGVIFSWNGAKLWANDDDEIQLTCTWEYSYNGETETKSRECNIITPEITRTGYTVQGYTWIQNYEVVDLNLLKWWSNLTLSLANSGDVYYVNSYKPITITFKRNWNNAQIKSWLTEETTSDIEEGCNIWNDNVNNCYIITPTIIPATWKNVKWYSTSWASFENEIAHQTQISVSAWKTYYAWSEYIPQTFTGYYTVWVWVNVIDVTSWSCTTEAKYNEESIVNSCKILLPEITVKQWYINPKWYNWDNEVVLDNEWKVEIDSNVTFTAKAIKDTYEITISSNNEEYGRVTSGSLTAEYWVAISTRGNKLTIWDVEILAIATWNTAQYSYQFSGWNSTCGDELAWNCTIEAEFTRTVNKYTITFYDENGERVLDTQTVNYGTNVTYGWEAPSKAATPKYTYTFVGWYTAKEGGTVDDLSNVVADRNVYASYSSTVNQYTVTFYDENGETVLDTQTVDYGTAATYGGATPSKAATAQYTYAFAGWYTAKEGGSVDELSNVTANRSVYARYNSTVNKYRVNFVDEDGTEILSGKYDYGTASGFITLPSDPTKLRLHNIHIVLLDGVLQLQK